MDNRILGIAAAVALLPVLSIPARTAPDSIEYTSQLSGSAETPPNTAKGTGTATLTIAGRSCTT